MLFYDKVVKIIVDAVKEKTREATSKLHTRILAIENTNLLFATKKEVEKKIEGIQEMINTEKNSLLGLIEEKISNVASMESVMSLAKGLNNRLDNMYMAMEVNKTQAVNQAKEIFEKPVNDIAKILSSNTIEIASIANKVSETISSLNETKLDIAKNVVETQDLKKVVDSLLPQIVKALDTNSLTAIIDSLVQVEMQAIEERMKEDLTTANSTQGEPISNGDSVSNGGNATPSV